ncbi:MAG: hypothetical protein M3334_02205 [Actinomycetota bacterium]|nr:hypothetical protein [Actinomycetota bacterium]
MESLFDTQTAKRRELPPAIRRLIVDLQAEYPAFNLNEIANIVYVRFGRQPDYRTVGRVLREEPWPLKMWRRFDPYHRIEEPRERRMAIVRLHSERVDREGHRWLSQDQPGHRLRDLEEVHRGGRGGS